MVRLPFPHLPFTGKLIWGECPQSASISKDFLSGILWHHFLSLDKNTGIYFTRLPSFIQK
jgi:hypothetical protein